MLGSVLWLKAIKFWAAIFRAAEMLLAERLGVITWEVSELLPSAGEGAMPTVAEGASLFMLVARDVPF